MLIGIGLKSGNNPHQLLSHQSSLPALAEGIASQRSNGSAVGSGVASSSLLWGELNKALGGLDNSSSTASSTNNGGLNQFHQLQVRILEKW